MLLALLYSCLRLLLDLVDVRLRVRDPEAEFFCSVISCAFCGGK
jgi:hypothetical protein